jgi:hypothetical protein
VPNRPRQPDPFVTAVVALVILWLASLYATRW